MKLSHRNNKGFTLVEALVAITILLLVIIGPMTAAQKGAQNAYFAREQLTAVFLAQEAIEAVFELRDTQAIAAYADVIEKKPTITDTAVWDTALVSAGCGSPSTGCAYDADNKSFKTCSIAANCKLFYDPIDGYTHDTGSGSVSPYTRKVYVTDEGGGSSGPWKVVSEVSWNTGSFSSGSTKTITLTSWIYDQYERYEH